MNAKPSFERRSFLQGLAALAATGWMAGGRGLAQTTQAVPGLRAAPWKGPRSLVCIYLNGGNDLFNVLVPTGPAEYSKYAQLRQGLALQQGSLLPLAGIGQGMHPACSGLRDLFDEGRLAVVANVGNLVEPLQLADYQASLAGASGGPKVPKNLFSHSDQTHAFWTGYAAEAGQTYTGWGGRLAERLVARNGGSDLPPSYTLAGTNAWQAADDPRAAQFALSPQSGARSFQSFDGSASPPHEAARSAVWDTLRQPSGSHPLREQLVESLDRAVDRNALVKSALQASADPGGGDLFATPYDPNNSIAAQLRMVARLIYAQRMLGQSAQVFYVSAGNWDSHGSQLSEQAGLLAQLDAGLNSFFRLTEELGIADEVTSFVASEFGRTLATNGDGTDHGWGTHYLAVGGAVRGGQVHGDLPSFELGGPDDVGNAILPRASTDQFGSTLAKWMGLTQGERLEVFPNLGNFPEDDLGFLKPSAG